MSAGGMWRNCDFHILFMSSRHKLFFLWSSFSSTLHGSRGWMFVTVLCLGHCALIYLLPPASLQCMYLLFHSRVPPPFPHSKTVIEQELSLLSFVGSFLPRAVVAHTKKSEWGVWRKVPSRCHASEWYVNHQIDNHP